MPVFSCQTPVHLYVFPIFKLKFSQSVYEFLVKMRGFFFSSILFFSYCIEAAFSWDSNRIALKKAFKNITEALVRQNYQMTIVFQSTRTDLTPIMSFADTPHVASRFTTKSGKFLLNSSAIVASDSVNFLKIFNERVDLSVNFLMTQQVFVYCQDGNFDEIASIPNSRAAMPIVQYEYYVVEEEKSIRLLTYAWFTPEKCKVAQLVEVNRFDKSTGR